MVQKSLNKRFNKAKTVLNITESTKTLEIYDSGKIIILDKPPPDGGSVVTLPLATEDNIGLRFDFFIKSKPNSLGGSTNSYTIQCGSTDDLYTGALTIVDVDTAGDTNTFQPDLSDDYQIFLNGDTKGRLVGGRFCLLYIAENRIQVNGFLVGTGTLLTPFSI